MNEKLIMKTVVCVTQSIPYSIHLTNVHYNSHWSVSRSLDSTINTGGILPEATLRYPAAVVHQDPGTWDLRDFGPFMCCSRLYIG